jgi:hypothetical protein
MQYADRLPSLPSPRTMVAIVIGAGAATGIYALLDDDSAGSVASTTRVIVAEPAQPGAGAAAKDEAAVAAAIGQPQDGVASRGSKASASGTAQNRLAPPESAASEDGTSGYRFAQPSP